MGDHEDPRNRYRILTLNTIKGKKILFVFRKVIRILYSINICVIYLVHLFS